MTTIDKIQDILVNAKHGQFISLDCRGDDENFDATVIQLGSDQVQHVKAENWEKGWPVTPESYVQDSAICFLDGEWNAGKEIHSSSITSWYDLTDNGHNANRSASSITFEKNYVNVSTLGTFLTINSGAYSTDESTVEIVCEPISCNSDYSRLWAMSENVNYRFAVGFYTNGWFAVQCGNIAGTYGKDQAYEGAVYNKKYYVCLAKSSVEDVALYVNGVKTPINNYFTSIYNPQNTINLFDNGTGKRSTSGKIFRFMSHNRRLSDAEIAKNYEIDKVRFGIS